MKKDISFVTPSLCSGCSACSALCPTKAIEIKEDHEGFLIPVIQAEKCTHCGLCYERCPSINPIRPKDNTSKPEAWSCWHKNNEVLLKSSSGGVFSALADEILKEGGVVYGACWTEDFTVIHQRATTAAELAPLRGSKYIQSQTAEIYLQVRVDLKSGRKVLFTGTPCQVAGLYTLLGQDDAGLYTADLVCHGVNSSLVFRAYLSYIKEISGKSVKQVNFRSKMNTEWEKYCVDITLEDGSVVSNQFNKDPFFHGFLSNYYLRKSCYHCLYARVPRVADVTLADFWCGEIKPSNFNKMGTSLVLINNFKGVCLFESVRDKLSIYLTSIDMAIVGNPIIARPVGCPRNNYKRLAIFKLIRNSGIVILFKKVLVPQVSLKNRTINFLKKIAVFK